MEDLQGPNMSTDYMPKIPKARARRYVLPLKNISQVWIKHISNCFSYRPVNILAPWNGDWV